MKFKLKMANEGSVEEFWIEDYDEEDVTPNNLQKWIDNTISFFNRTLRPSEKRRVCLGIVEPIKTAYLEILTWVDSMIVSGKHYYGSIRFGKIAKVDVKHVLTRKGAEALNISSREDFFPGSKYKVGELTTRFADRDELIQEAIELFNKDSHGYNVLLDGDHCSCDPYKMIVAPNGLADKANSIWEEYEKFQDDTRYVRILSKEQDAEHRGICDRWDSVLGCKFFERDNLNLKDE